MPTIGFGTGLVSDLFLPTPFGLSALVGCLVGFAVGLATMALDRTAWWLAPVAALGGSALYEVTYGALGSVLGQPQMLHVALARIVVVVSVTNAVLALPAMRLMSWGMARRLDRGDAHLRRRRRGRPMTVRPVDDVRTAPPYRAAAYRWAPVLGYWSPVSRSLRHPFGDKRIFGHLDRGPDRPGQDPPAPHARRVGSRSRRYSTPRTPPSPVPDSACASWGSPWSSCSALLGLRLWALQVLQAPAAAQAVVANQIRVGPDRPRPGVSSSTATATRWSTTWPPSRSPCPGWRPSRTRRSIGRLAALVGETPAQVQAAIDNDQYSLYKPVPILNDAPLADVIYIKEHQAEFPGVSSIQTTQRTYPQTELPGPAQSAYPASQVLGYVGTINTAELASRASQGYMAGDAFGQSGLEYQYETRAARHTRAASSSRSTPRARWPACSRRPPSTARATTS